MFSPEERIQYNRHLILPEIGAEGQAKLKAAKVLVIGAGGLSCPVLLYLASAGVGTLGIVDGDKVDQSNLQRQILFDHSNIGLPKAEVAKQKLLAINPFIEVKSYVEMLTVANAVSLIEQYDVVVDGSDNFQTRYLVNDACQLSNKPLVFGSIFKFEGQVSVFHHQDGPTYRCLYPDPPAPDSVPNCSDIGVLGVLPGLIGSYQANETIKIITGIGKVLSGQLLCINALNNQQYVLNVEKSEQSTVKELADDYDAFCGIKVVDEEIDFEHYLQHKEEYDLLDVRNADERAREHIGGIHIPLPQLLAKKQYLPKKNRVLVYCQSGMRSQKAIELLQEAGVDKQFVNLKGGLNAKHL